MTLMMFCSIATDYDRSGVVVRYLQIVSMVSEQENQQNWPDFV